MALSMSVLTISIMCLRQPAQGVLLRTLPQSPVQSSTLTNSTIYSRYNKIQSIQQAYLIAGGFAGENRQCSHLSKVAEISLSVKLLKERELNGDCLVYIFGVARRDKFTSHIGAHYKSCQVFAFDPTVDEREFTGGVTIMFGQNVSFRSWGLYGGNGPRMENWSHPVYGKVHGEMYTLSEIVARLGHKGRRLSYLRADCEGCEWSWVDTVMREDPQVFELIDQMFIEVHFAKTLRFTEQTLSLVPSLYRMMEDNFIMCAMNTNNGWRSDQYQVPQALVNAGVDPKPCCREFFLINKRVS